MPATRATAADRDGKLQLLRRVSGVGYLLSSLLSAAGLLAPDPMPGDHAAALLLVAGMLACGSLLLGGRRLPDWAIKLVAIAGGSLFTSLSAAFVHPLGITPLFYVYPAMTSGYFGTRRDAAAQVVLTALGFAAALAIDGHELQPGALVMGTVIVDAVVTAGVRYVAELNDRLMSRLAEVASTDALTGLRNRHTVDAAADRELEHARRTGGPLSVVLFDLDHFKRINDERGHTAGDDALRHFARILGEHASVADVAARWGGEEFLAVLPGRDAHAARHWATGVAERLERESAEAGVPLTTSAGVATVVDGDSTLDRLIMDADGALYAAKAAGRRRVLAA